MHLYLTMIFSMMFHYLAITRPSILKATEITSQFEFVNISVSYGPLAFLQNFKLRSLFNFSLVTIATNQFGHTFCAAHR